MRIRRLLGAALAMSVLLGGLLLATVTAGPAAACTCLEGTRSRPFPLPPPVVFTFEVSRVYKGAVGQRQEIVTPGGGDAGCGGFGIGLRGAGPFLVFADQASNAVYQIGPGQYGSSMCSGSRALTDRAPNLGGLPARELGGQDHGPSGAGLAVGVGVLAAVVVAGLAVLRVRRRPNAA